MKAIPIGQLRWRCRRGTKELDQILGTYLEKEYQQASAELQNGFVALLKENDPDIYDWLFGAVEVNDPNLINIIRAIRLSIA